MDEATTERVLQDSMFELDNLSAYLGKLKDMVCADERETLLRPSAFNLRELVEKVVRLTNIPAGKKVSFSTAFPPYWVGIELRSPNSRGASWFSIPAK